MAPDLPASNLLPPDPSVPTRRLRRDAEENRRQILDAAGRLMAQRGLAAPLDEIAAAAGVGIATLYRRFPSRDALVEALFEDRVAAYVADLEGAVAMPDGWDALVWFLRRATARQIADRALAELIDHEPLHGTVRGLLERLWPLVEALVTNARATGRLRPDVTAGDLLLLQKALAVVGTALAPLDPDAWTRHLTIVLDGLAVSRGAPSPLGRPALPIDRLHDLATHQRPPAPAPT